MKKEGYDSPAIGRLMATPLAFTNGTASVRMRDAIPHLVACLGQVRRRAQPQHSEADALGSAHT